MDEDELNRWAASVFGGGFREWTVVDDPELAREFGRVWAGELGRPPVLELFQLAAAPGALRVSYAGSALVARVADDAARETVVAYVRSAAVALSGRHRAHGA